MSPDHSGSPERLGLSRRFGINEHRAVAPLRGFLVLFFGVLVLFQTMSMPGQWRHMAKENPEEAYLRWSLTVISIFLILCVQVVIVATWKLLSRVQTGRIFSPDSFVWVDAIVYSVAAAWAVLAGLFLYVGFKADDPGVPLLMFLMLIGIAVLGLLMVVMRALLRQATSLRADLESVI